MPSPISNVSEIKLFAYGTKDTSTARRPEASVLFELIADRYESNSLVLTSNQPVSDWDQIFPDNVMAVAAVDRLVHHATIINIKEKSYRQLRSQQFEK